MLTEIYTCRECSRSLEARLFRPERKDGTRVCTVCTNLRTKYNISYDEYRNLLLLQNSLCGICDKDLLMDVRPSIDHSHSCCSGYKSCGKCIRKVLCNGCNVGLGCVNDSIELLERFLRYLFSGYTAIPSNEASIQFDSSGERKRCINCELDVPISKFAIRPKSKTLYSWCNRCVCLHKYGLNQRTYLAILSYQNNSCKVCLKRPQDQNRHLSVDHDHSCCKGVGSCGKCIRGLLCSDCNRFLGYVQDNPFTIGRMIDYLEQHASL